jgi:hypothetical protein
MNESEFRWVDDPAVALSTTGDALVVWADQSQKDLFFQRFDAANRRQLPRPTRVSNSPATFSWLPRIVVSANAPEQLFVLWQEILFSGGSHGGDILFARSTDGGRTFSEPLNLSQSLAGDGKGRLSAKIWDNGSLDLALSSKGVLYAVWTEYEGALWLRRSRDGGQTFDTAVLIAGTASAPARGPSVATGADGRVELAWALGEDPASDIHWASSTSHGESFGAVQRASRTRGHSDAPKLAIDVKGTAHLVYAEAAREGSRIYYARRPMNDAQFEPPRVLPVLGGRAGGAHFPQLAVDPRSGVFVVWEQRTERSSRGTDLGYTFSKDGGQSFVPAGRVLGVSGARLGWNGSQQGGLTEKLVTNETGSFALVNSTFRPEQVSHVWLVRGQYH